MSTQGKEYKLAIKIAGIVDKSFTTSLTTVDTALNEKLAKINADFTKMDKGLESVMNVGKKCFSAIATAAGVAATAIGAATAASISAGSNFESAFAGVKKTVDATDEEYESLRQSILEMTKTIPSSAADIAGVMEIAGQLGIANDSLVDFTETMINMGVSTDLAAEDAATALARFANIVSMDAYGEDGISNYERLGSVIVDLGNKFATTEGEIVGIAEALAAAGNLAGMTESQIMGISAAMSSVGLTEESGASSMSRLIMQMQQAVAEGGGQLEKYANYSGMSSGEFASLFRSDASKALIAFIGGLSEAGEGAYGILEDLDLSTIRLRKSFLSLAGADDLLGNAVDVANAAWEENTALAIEAGKRYETAESKVQLMNQAVQRLGIAAYDELREPYVDVIETITEKVNGLTEYVSGPDGIGDWIENIGTSLPTLQRKFRKYGEPVFDGILNTGKWVVKHGDGIISVIAGIGGAMAAYKAISTGVHLAAFITTLTPAAGIILGTVSAIGALTAAFVAYKKHEQDMVDDNLAEHFGNIALSMQEIKAVAEHIIDSESLKSVNKALTEFGNLDTIAGTMEDYISEIEKMNWKISIGMELTEDEQESYKDAIAGYVSKAQEYALQSQYAVSLNLAVLFDPEDPVADKINQFYADSYSEISALGTQLNEAMTEAFNDGLLDIDEVKTITRIQSQMAEIEKMLATGEFDAQLSMLSMDYAGGGSLTPESFQNLQAEIAQQVTQATESYKRSYAKNYAAIQASYDGGYLTEEEYQSALEAINEEYLKNIGDLQAKSLNFQLNTIMGQYPDEVEAFREIFDSVMEEYSDGDWENAPVQMLTAMMQDIYSSDELDDTTKKAIEKLLTAMEPTIEQAESLKQQYAELGIQLSDELTAAFANIDLLGAMTVRQGLFGQKGNKKALSNYVLSGIVNNESYSEIEKTLRGYGWELPIGQRANGGLATSPELTWFAENGPEMAIPIDGSRNAISLWEKTGRLLGMESVMDRLDLGGGSGPAIEYRPTLQFYGEAPSKDDLTSALKVSQDEFEGLMERYFKTHGRVSFG